ncbi:MAG: site-specific integrase, partial [Bacteroidota bacterium]
QKGNRPLTVSYANRLIKSWCKTINLRGNYCTHTLRKTFGYIQRKHYGVGYDILCKRFNHSSPAVTMRYLGIEDKEVNGILMNEI